MTAEEHKALARRYFAELIDGGDVSVADEVLADPVLEKGRPVRPARFKELTALLHAAFPDWQTAIAAQYVDGDTVISRVVARGTYAGTYLGIPATGRWVERGGIFIFRIRDGRIAEIWDEIDQLGLLRQLGATVTLADGTGTTEASHRSGAGGP